MNMRAWTEDPYSIARISPSIFYIDKRCRIRTCTKNEYREGERGKMSLKFKMHWLRDIFQRHIAKRASMLKTLVDNVTDLSFFFCRRRFSVWFACYWICYIVPWYRFMVRAKNMHVLIAMRKMVKTKSARHMRLRTKKTAINAKMERKTSKRARERDTVPEERKSHMVWIAFNGNQCV